MKYNFVAKYLNKFNKNKRHRDKTKYNKKQKHKKGHDNTEDHGLFC